MKTTRLSASHLLLLSSISMMSSTLNAEESFKVCADPINPPYSTKEQTGYENKIAQLLGKRSLNTALDFS